MRPFALLLLLGCPATETDTGEAPVGPADADGDGFDVENDCDDDDAAVNAGADELCNGADDDCDGVVDEEPVDITTWYADSDRDGYGDAAARKTACDAPDGYVADGTDCNDASTDYHPGATETACAGPDYNCNGVFDEGDADGDGFASCDDCDDTRVEVQPGAAEACDGLDNNCDGTIDEGAGDSLTFYADTDGDLYGDAATPIEACAVPPGASETKNDCDDTDDKVHPGADEYCNGIDDDCDDEEDEEAVDRTAWFEDADSDGYGGASRSTMACDAPAGYDDSSDDCNDGNGAVHPGASEYCGGIDWDCDLAVNEADSVDIVAYYSDTDGDGYYGTYAGAACYAPAGYDASGSDCDEADRSINPAAEDICDDVDNNCDSVIDDGLSVPGVYGTIQAAINASSSGEHVCVATGEYNEDIDFGSRSITVEGMDGSDYTVIAGTGRGTVVTISSGTPILRGFTIKGGDGGSGAGMYIYGADVVLDDLVISSNTCSEEYCYGVGAQVYYANVTATDVVISGNTATPALGTSSYVYVTGVGLDATGCTGSWEGLEVSGNTATSPTLAASQYAYLYGTGVYLSSDASSFTDMVVDDNTASRAGGSSSSYAYAYGGGMYVGYGSSTFDGLTVQSNTISTLGYYDYGQGAGLHLSQDTSSYEHLDVRANVLDTHYGMGGGMFMSYYSTPAITNAIIAGNKVGFSSTATNYAHGAGIATGDYSVPVLENVDIYGNKGAGEYASGGGIYLYYYGGIDTNNVAVTGNTLSYTVSGGGGALGMYSSSYLGTYAFTYSNFYGNTAAEFSGISTVVGSSGNIGVTPGYTSVSGSDPTAWNLLLSGTSAMLNVGDSTLSDVDGTRSDIGAYGGAGGGW